MLKIEKSEKHKIKLTDDEARLLVRCIIFTLKGPYQVVDCDEDVRFALIEKALVLGSEIIG